jgi:hypothetical protein
MIRQVKGSKKALRAAEPKDFGNGFDEQARFSGAKASNIARQ